MQHSHTMDWLLGSEASKLRANRAPKWVAHIEVSNYTFVELDALDMDHAMRLIDVWVNQFGALTGAMRRVHSFNHDLGPVVGRIISAD